MIASTLAAAAMALVALAPPARALEAPEQLDLARASAPIEDVVLPATSRRRLAAATAASWGGAVRAATGETVTVLVSDSYPQDPAFQQRWADFLAGLLHGSELGRLTALLAPAEQVSSICGSDAAACYSADRQLLVAPGEDPAPDLSAEAVVAHEYGHHVAANRSNAPWLAVETGTKRWASYVQVCSRAQDGRLFPGAEEGPRYRLNPGEGFAESYRVLNERRLGRAETPWLILEDILRPDEEALRAVEQDVVSPWSGASVSTFAGTLRRGSRSRTVATPYDGLAQVTLRAPARSRFALDVYSAGGARVGRAVATTQARTVTVRTTVCGGRSYRIGVSRLTGGGRYEVTVARP